MTRILNACPAGFIPKEDSSTETPSLQTFEEFGFSWREQIGLPPALQKMQRTASSAPTWASPHTPTFITAPRQKLLSLHESHEIKNYGCSTFLPAHMLGYSFGSRKVVTNLVNAEMHSPVMLFCWLLAFMGQDRLTKCRNKVLKIIKVYLRGQCR